MDYIRLTFGFITKEWEIESKSREKVSCYGKYFMLKEILKGLYREHILCIEKAAYMFRREVRKKSSITYSFCLLESLKGLRGLKEKIQVT